MIAARRGHAFVRLLRRPAASGSMFLMTEPDQYDYNPQLMTGDRYIMQKRSGLSRSPCRTLGIVVVAVLLSGAVSVNAHEQFRIIGKIVKFEKLQLVVDTAYSERFVLNLQEGTPIQRDKKRVSAKELKAGRSVVVDVSGDTLYDDNLFVIAVMLVPSTARR
jgi:hypothetical protein